VELTKCHIRICIHGVGLKKCQTRICFYDELRNVTGICFHDAEVRNVTKEFAFMMSYETSLEFAFMKWSYEMPHRNLHSWCGVKEMSNTNLLL
jgi:hypothetical protein